MMQASRFSGTILRVETDEDHRKLIIAFLFFRNNPDSVIFTDFIFYHRVSDIVRYVHAHPDAVYLSQSLIVGMAETPSILFCKFPELRKIGYPASFSSFRQKEVKNRIRFFAVPARI